MQSFYEKHLGAPGRRVGGGRLYFDCGPVILALLEPTVKGDPNALPSIDSIYLATEDPEGVHCRAKSFECLAPGKIHGDPAGEMVLRL